ncbi:S41 family peptidase [Desulfosporosinus sp. PR]|uniref:S41 family peptidase n=1 Tax=Candidatus Desulfosporosinus nitrosoreducens TaxID=3401928 RepID=UPI0027FA3487|nr:S41 family peptidase [Desulfosporosinus sp. PR]MDQ7093922.1 S41 family peptidase [Desulfosporosinus sp. PR]
MTKSFFRKKVIRRFSILMLVLILILSTSTSVWASTKDDVLPEIRSLLQTQYADPVSQDVLNAPTIDEMLKRLDDPHTTYFSPEEYQDFVDSINMSFTGIGIHIDMLPEGVKVVAVVQGSPAEEVGLKAGDVIVSADGQSLAGLSAEQAVSFLRGPEGSTVQISVKRGTETKDFTVTRQAVSEPTVEGSVLDGHIGYIQLESFGDETPVEFASTVVKLDYQNVDSWVIDLRDNGGGYLTSAISLAGFFIGPNVAVKVKDRTGVLQLYQAPDQPFRLNQPIIFLTNENSASASEILTSAVKDYREATIVGTRTYGKGTVQTIFPLSNGGVLKMTVDHFYSAFGHEINRVGITPDVNIVNADPLKAAELMLSDKQSALDLATTPDYWEAWRELANSTATTVKPESYSLYYPDYHKADEIANVPLTKKFEVHFNGAVDWQSVNDSSIELIDSMTGERVLTTFETLDSSDVQVIPEQALSADSTYWLVIHPTVKNTSGKILSGGTVTVLHTVQGAGNEQKAQVQSAGNFRPVGERNLPGFSDPDYGWAIQDLAKK